MAAFQVNFVIAGAQKAGTTALASFLAQHPEICHSPTKELHFFDSRRFDDSAPRASIEANYHALFPNYAGERFIGESTPIYLFLPCVAARMQRYNPEMKLIILLREPASRAISQYHMVAQLGKERRSIGAAFLLEQVRPFLRMFGLSGFVRKRSFVARGWYSRQIRHLLRFFPRKQMLFLKSDDLAHHHRHTLQQVYAFLGLEDRSYFPPARKVGVGQSASPTPWWLRALLRLAYKREISRVERLLGWDLADWRTRRSRV